MTEREKQALTKVVNYLFEDEQEDYENNDMPDVHIYKELVILRKFLYQNGQ